ncbi:hypothetical protein [Archangium sp.]|uniref:hypothetical protein n=1 Tax=Archangium sp. TaxID=1872627 RepID=UPI002D3C7307|nr:hypothetical protein [Archangium sp.]HYO51235.1 hypothetical protein [Archangium sp.]
MQRTPLGAVTYANTRRLPYAGVKVPATGTAIEVVSTSAQDGFMQVHVRPAN